MESVVAESEEEDIAPEFGEIGEGSFVFIPVEEDGFAKVKVSSVHDNALTVQFGERGRSDIVDQTEKKRVPFSQVLPVNPVAQDGVPDNTQLMFLHDAALLHNIRMRYERKQIYTYTAFILIVVNPYQDLGLYTQRVVQQYRGKALGTQPPHVFATADRAYRNMKALNLNQSIVVSGESGAGKTETCKHIMRYLTAVSASATGHFTAQGDSGAEEHEVEVALDASRLEKQILEANPVLESFGNAKTLRNNNSSRFGKFTEMNFDKDNHVCGASIVTYLLEKSRLVFQSKGERNFHIFYQLLAGASDAMREEFQLPPREDADGTPAADLFRYTNQSGTYAIDGLDDQTNPTLSYETTIKAMKVLGIGEDTQKQIFGVLAALLHLGNVEFKEDRNEASHVENGEEVEIAAKLLQVSPQDFQKALCIRMIRTRFEKRPIPKPQNAQNAAYARDALAKDIYGRLFEWLVEQINLVLIPDKKLVKVSEGIVVFTSFIGILDIFGFEFFENNSFEQLCINHANEKLQQHFNIQVLMQEQELYEKEAIRFDPIEYEDNTDTIELVDDPHKGILSLLEEECRMPSASDKTFTRKVEQKHARHPKLQVPSRSKNRKMRKFTDEEAFLVRHFAGEVCYQTKGFMDKNNDDLMADLLELVLTSNAGIMQTLYAPDAKDRASAAAAEAQPGRPGRAPKKRFKSVGGKFAKQVQQLMTNLGRTTSHFVRCIKPNSIQKASVFEGTMVLQQLRCSGMLETLILMQKGFPTRCPFEDLSTRYRSMMPPVLASLDPPEFCEALLMALDLSPKEFQLGITKVFFRAGKLAFLEKLNAEDPTMAEEVVRKVYRWLRLKKLKRAVWTVVAVIRLGYRIRQMRALARFESAGYQMTYIYRPWIKLAHRVHLNHAAKKIQAVYRMVKWVRLMDQMKKGIIKIQAMIRGRLVWLKFKDDLALLKDDRLEMERQIKEEEKRRKEEARERRQLEKELADKTRRDEAKARIRARLDELNGKAAASDVAGDVPPNAVVLPTGVDMAWLERLKKDQDMGVDQRAREEVELYRNRTDLRLKEVETMLKDYQERFEKERQRRQRLEAAVVQWAHATGTGAGASIQKILNVGAAEAGYADAFASLVQQHPLASLGASAPNLLAAPANEISRTRRSVQFGPSGAAAQLPQNSMLSGARRNARSRSSTVADASDTRGIVSFVVPEGVPTQKLSPTARRTKFSHKRMQSVPANMLGRIGPTGQELTRNEIQSTDALGGSPEPAFDEEGHQLVMGMAAASSEGPEAGTASGDGQAMVAARALARRPQPSKRGPGQFRHSRMQSVPAHILMAKVDTTQSQLVDGEEGGRTWARSRFAARRYSSSDEDNDSLLRSRSDTMESDLSDVSSFSSSPQRALSMRGARNATPTDGLPAMVKNGSFLVVDPEHTSHVAVRELAGVAAEDTEVIMSNNALGQKLCESVGLTEVVREQVLHLRSDLSQQNARAAELQRRKVSLEAEHDRLEQMQASAENFYSRLRRDAAVGGARGSGMVPYNFQLDESKLHSSSHQVTLLWTRLIFALACLICLAIILVI